MTQGRINYIQFEPAAFLADSDVQSWSAEVVGAYWLLICYLYTNKGKCLADSNAMAVLCHCQNNWDEVWEKISKKFSKRKGFIFHKRVSKELAEAKRRIQAKQRAGVMGAEKRWHNHSKGNGTPIAKERKGKVRKGKVKSSVFTPPKNIQEVDKYIQEKGYTNVNAKTFFDYFTESGWVDSTGKKVRNWKLKIITWSKYGTPNTKGLAQDSNQNRRTAFEGQESAIGTTIE